MTTTINTDPLARATLLFAHRDTLSDDELCIVFGTWCLHHVASATAPPAEMAFEDIYEHIMTGKSFHHSRDQEILIIAHAVARTRLARSIRGKHLYRPDTRDPARMVLTNAAILAADAYVHGLEWANTRDAILATHTVLQMQPCPHPDNIIQWIMSIIDNGLPDNKLEYGLVELYCAVNTPVCVSIRTQRHTKRAYSRLRDLDAQFPTGTFADDIRRCKETIPRDIITNESIRAKDPILYATACLAILAIFMEVVMTHDNALLKVTPTAATMHTTVITTPANAGPAWCNLFGIYFDYADTYIRLPDDTVVRPHISTTDDAAYPHCTGLDILYTYFTHLHTHFPDNRMIASIVAFFNTHHLPAAAPTPVLAAASCLF